MNELYTIFIINSSHAKFVMLSALNHAPRSKQWAPWEKFEDKIIENWNTGV
jgi:hypothetical protein